MSWLAHPLAPMAFALIVWIRAAMSLLEAEARFVWWKLIAHRTAVGYLSWVATVVVLWT